MIQTIPFFIVPRFKLFIKEQIDILSNLYKRSYLYLPYNRLTDPLFHIPICIFKNYLKNYLFENLVDINDINAKMKLILHPYVSFKPNSMNYKLGNKILESFVINHLDNIKTKKLGFIHSHFIWPCGFIGQKLSFNLNLPSILTIHGTWLHDIPFKNKKWYKIIFQVLNKTTHLIVVSDFLSRILTENFLIPDHKISVIPNGFNTELFNVRSKDKIKTYLNIKTSKKIILNVANLNKVKDHNTLINAINHLRKIRKIDDFICIIIGEGILKRELKKLIAKLNLTKHIFLLGRKPHKEISYWMNVSDIFVLSSIKEGFGIVQLEALASGLPVIATKNGGSESIIKNNDLGRLVETQNYHQLALAINDSLDKTWDREMMSNYAHENYNWNFICDKIYSLYEKL